MTDTKTRNEIGDVFAAYTTQQLVDVVVSFNAGNIKLVIVKDSAAISPAAHNWLNDCEKVLLDTLKVELARRSAQT